MAPAGAGVSVSSAAGHPSPSLTPAGDGSVSSVVTGGGYFTILVQFGTAIAAPTAITMTRMAIPFPSLRGDVLVMDWWFSSSVVIILLAYLEWVFHIRRFSFSCASQHIDDHDNV